MTAPSSFLSLSQPVDFLFRREAEESARESASKRSERGVSGEGRWLKSGLGGLVLFKGGQGERDGG